MVFAIFCSVFFWNRLQYYRLMSIYSGFATRFQEQAYDHCIDSLLYVLQKRIIKFYKGEQADESKFISVVLKLQQQMRQMEKSKYLQPKSSQSVNELAKFMQLFEHNIIQMGQQDQSIQQENQTVPLIQVKQIPEETPEQKKKEIFWVQKVPKEEENKHQMQRETENNTNNNQNQKQETSQQKKIAQFRRTTYQNNNIRSVKVKNTSRTNLSRDRDEISQIGLANKLQKNRSISSYAQQKQPSLYSKAALQNNGVDEGNMVRKRKMKSGSKGFSQAEIPAVGVRNEVADIIREYIIKTKRNKIVSRNSRHNIEYLGKLNDF